MMDAAEELSATHTSAVPAPVFCWRLSRVHVWEPVSVMAEEPRPATPLPLAMPTHATRRELEAGVNDADVTAAPLAAANAG